ncbi:MAG: GAF domain-containing protein [Chloroflexi bacterium]|nr:GAF domain-containing protein [Chloroflexota bacterium]
MRTIQQALAQPHGVSPEQLIGEIQEWQQLVAQLANNPAPETELATLYEITKALNSSLDLAETLSLVMDSLIQLTGAERSCLMLFDDEGILNIQAARHFDQKNVAAADLELSYTVVRDVVEGGQPVLSTNAQLDPRFSAQDSVVGFQLRSIVCVPLYVRERMIGALYMDNRLKAGVFSQSNLPILTAFANQAAASIGNARLFEIERKQREMTEALAKAAAVVNSSLDLDHVLDRILEQVERVVPGNTFNIMLLKDQDDENDIAWMVRRRGYDHQITEEESLGIRIHVAKYPNLDKMMRTRKPVVVPDTAVDPDWVAAEGQEWRLSYVAAPILIADRTVGFLNVNGTQPGQFSPADAQQMEIFAHHAATALENARMYQESRLHAEELAATVVQLRELDRLKSEFVQNVSHELRTPLSVIQGYTSLLEAGELGELKPKQQESVSAIYRRVQALCDMVEDITLILGVETNPPEPEPVSLNSLVGIVLQDFRLMIGKAQITLRTEISPNLPLTSGSPPHLRRMVDSLLSNAIKFTPAGGAIAVQLRQEGDQIVLRVADTGIGISPDQQACIFDRFYQIDGSASRRYEGMGLGLALAKEVVEIYGGTIGVESVVGKGSIFTVTLPITEE